MADVDWGDLEAQVGSKILEAVNHSDPDVRKSEARNPKPETRNPKSEIRNPKPEIRNPKPETIPTPQFPVNAARQGVDVNA